MSSTFITQVNSPLSDNFNHNNDIVTFFTSNNAFTSLHRDGSINTFGDISGGTITPSQDQNLSRYLFDIFNAPNTHRAFVAEKYYYNIHDNTNNPIDVWLRPIQMTSSGELRRDEITFQRRTIYPNPPSNGVFNIYNMLNNSGTNLHYYRSHISNAIFTQNQHIHSFLYTSFQDLMTEDFIANTDISNHELPDKVKIFKANQSVSIQTILLNDYSIYIPLQHIQDWFELFYDDGNGNSTNFLFRNHLHDGLRMDIFNGDEQGVIDIDKIGKDNILSRNFQNPSSNEEKDKIVVYTQKDMYGFIIHKYNPIKEEDDDEKPIDYNKLFVQHYSGLLRHRPIG